MLRPMRGTKRLLAITAMIGVALACACSGSTPPSEAPEPEPEPAMPEPAPPAEEPAEPEEKPEEEPAKTGVEPEFKDGMSVEEAINAVPQGTERENVDQEALSRPLMDAKIYDPCKPKPNQKFKLKVAVWDGRAVGIDVLPTPKNDQFADCIKQQVSQVQWKDKVKSLNTVEFNY